MSLASPISPVSVAPLPIDALNAELRRLTRLAKNSAIVRDLSTAGQVHTDILRIREQIKQQKAGNQ